MSVFQPPGDRWKFAIIEGETESISYAGKRRRRKTVLIKFGSSKISKRAFQLGLLAVIFQLLDGILTYVGLNFAGLDLEGNRIISTSMEIYGVLPALLLFKTFAVLLIVGLTLYAHQRLWVRPLLAMLCAFYLTLAIVPWSYIISDIYASSL
jgi:hypothetical protein